VTGFYYVAQADHKLASASEVLGLQHAGRAGNMTKMVEW
jgi:hypothetical protein